MTAAAFSATYADFKLIKTRSCVQLIFEVPLEQADQALAVMGGMPSPAFERWFAIAALRKEGDQCDKHSLTPPIKLAADPVPVSDTDRPHLPRRRVAPEKRLAQQAGILCADPVFQQWLYERCCIVSRNEECAAEFVRAHCGDITSRADLTPGSAAAAKWTELESQFTAWKLVA